VASKSERELITVDGLEVSISSPSKVLFPAAGYTKRDVVHYYLAVAEGALRGAGGRPNVLVRYPRGVGQEFFYQKRAPSSRPDWLEVVALRFPSGRSAEEVVPRNAAALAWMANMNCLELHPHPVRAEDLEHPDELRIDLDPVPGVPWSQLREVALVAQEALEELGLIGFLKTSGSRGIHIVVRIEPRWTFPEVRRAALAFAREVERRAPTLATSKWWKEERHGVFLDYNQNAKDRTVASAYAIRPTADARVSAPLDWSELAAAEPADFTLRTMPARFRELGDRHAAIDESARSLERLLELSQRQERAGMGDAPWPPHYAKQAGEPARVAPSRAASSSAKTATKIKKRSAAQREGEREHAADSQVGADGQAGADTQAHADRQAGTDGQGVAGRAHRSSPITAAGKRVGRTPRHPLIEIGRAAKKEDALAGLARWKARHPAVAARLLPADVLVDSMRGRYTTWTRIRINLQHVPEHERPSQEPLDPDEQPSR
jgi:bifunctional non-homologous end joining protein LigD